MLFCCNKKLVILYTTWIIVPEMQRTEIEKFSDRLKMNSTLKRDSLAQIIQLTSRNFPEELVEGMQSQISQREMGVTLRSCVCFLQSFLFGATYVYKYSTVKFSGFKGKLRTKRKVQWNPESGLLVGTIRISLSIPTQYGCYFCQSPVDGSLLVVSVSLQG